MPTTDPTHAELALAIPRARMRTLASSVHTDSLQLLASPACSEVFQADLTKISSAALKLDGLLAHLLDPASWPGLLADGLNVSLKRFLRHELRTPLNHIIGYSEMLQEALEDTPDLETASLSDALTRMQDTGRRLLVLLDETLSLELPWDEHTAEADSREASSASAPPILAEREPVSARPPLASASSTEPGLETASSSLPYGPILLVDDDGLNRDLLGRRLERSGYSVAQVASGQEALDFLAHQPCDLILLDVLMPGLSGYDVLERLKADTRLREIPVLMISALDELASVVRCIAIGAEDYLPKPVEPVLLQARVQTCLEKKRLRDLELDFLRQVQRLTDAAAAVEQARFEPESVQDLAARTDALGTLSRVFSRMAREVQAREQRLRQELQVLKVEVVETRKARQVAEIMEKDYFQRLKRRDRKLDVG